MTQIPIFNLLKSLNKLTYSRLISLERLWVNLRVGIMNLIFSRRHRIQRLTKMRTYDRDGVIIRNFGKMNLSPDKILRHPFFNTIGSFFNLFKHSTKSFTSFLAVLC